MHCQNKDVGVIDGHIHLTSPEIINNIDQFRAQEPYFDLLCSSPVNKNITAENLIVHMDETGLKQAVVFGFAFQSMDLCRQVNDYIIKMVDKYPERLIGFAVVNPKAKGVAQELERCKAAGLEGVGELFPSGQQFEITAKKQMAVVCDYCQENNWPVLIHLNEPVGHFYIGKTSDSIQQGAILAQNFPQTTFIYAHLGGGLCFYELMPEMQARLSNVYYDTAAVPYLYKKDVYNTLKAAGVIKKVILGSDYPLISPETYVKTIMATKLSQKEQGYIFEENIKRILNVGSKR